MKPTTDPLPAHNAPLKNATFYVVSERPDVRFMQWLQGRFGEGCCKVIASLFDLHPTEAKGGTPVRVVFLDESKLVELPTFVSRSATDHTTIALLASAPNEDNMVSWIEMGADGIIDLEASDSSIWANEVTLMIARKKGTLRHFNSQSALKEQANALFFESILTHANIGIAYTDARGNFLYVNRGLCELLGYTEKELLKLSIREVEPAEAFEKELVFIQEALANERDHYQLEQQLKKKDGTVISIDLSVSVIRDARGTLTHLIGTIADITAHKESEAALLESKAELLASEALKTSVIESLNEGLVVQDTHDKVVLANKAACDILELSEEQLRGMSSMDPLWHATDLDGRPVQPESFPSIKALQSKQPVRDHKMMIRTGSGKRKTILVNSSPCAMEDGEVIQTVTTLIDITREIEVQESIKQSEEQYRTIYHAMGLGVGYFTADGTVISFNEIALRNVQQPMEEVEGKHLSELFGAENAAKYLERFRGVVQDSSQNYFVDEIELTGGNKWFKSFYSAVNNAEGEITGFLIVSEDITAQKNTELALAESELQYRFLTESLKEVVWEADVDTEVKFINRHGKRLLGDQYDLLMEKGWPEVVHPDDLVGLQDNWESSLRTKSEFTHEARARVADGSYHWFKVSASPVLDAESNLTSWIGISVDITDQKNAEQRLEEDRSRMQFLAERSAELLRIDNVSELYHYAGDELHSLFSREAALILTSFNHNGTEFKVSALQGVSRWAEAFIDRFQMEATKVSGKVPPFLIESLKSGKVVQLGKDLSDLSSGAISKEMVKGIKEILPPYEMHSIGFVESGKVLGAAHVLSMGTLDRTDFALVELFCTQVSGALSKLRAFENLKLSEDRFRGVITSFKDIVFTMDTEGKYNGVYGDWMNESAHASKKFINRSPIDVYGKKLGKIHLDALKSASKGQSITYEWELPTNADSIKRYQTTLTPVYRADGKLTGYLGVGRDITDRWQYEQTIVQNAARLNRLAKYSSELLKINEKTKVYDYISEVVYDIIEKKGLVIVSEMEPESWSFEVRSVHGMNKMMTSVMQAVGRSAIGLKGKLSSYMAERMNSDEVINLSLDMRKITDKGFAQHFPKNVISMIGIRDLKVMMVLREGVPIASVTLALSQPTEDLNTELIRTFLNQASLALSRSETVFQVFQSQRALEEAQRIAKIGSWIYHAQDRSFRFSKEAKRIIEIEHDEDLENEGLLAIVPPADREFVEKQYDQLTKGNSIDIEHRFIGRDGKEKWLNVIATPQMNGLSLFSVEGTIHDVTKRKQAELRMEESEVRFRNLIEHNSTDIIMVLDESQKVHYVSPSVRQVLGYRVSDVLNAESLSALVHTADRDMAESQFHEVTNKVKSQAQSKVRLLTGKGAFLWTSMTLSDQRHVRGVNGIVLNVKNIDHEERTAQELKESYERFELVSQATRDVIWDYDLKTQRVKRSKAFEELYGQSIESESQETWLSLIHPRDREGTLASIERAIESKEQSTWTYEYRIQRADGSYAWVLDHASIVRDPDGTAKRMIGAMNDITERITYEQSIEAQNEKLKEIAWMQSHMVRAPLANLIALMELLEHPQEDDREKIEKMVLKSAKELDQVIRSIVKNAERFERQEGATSIKRYEYLGQDLDELYLHPALLDAATRAYTITNKLDQIVYANAAFEELSGYAFDEIKGHSHSTMLVGDLVNQDVLAFSNQKEQDREPYEAEVLCKRKDGITFWMRVTAQPFISKKGTFSGYFYTLKDISSEKKAEQTVIDKTKTLARINEELRHFTYTISHDLKEPVNSLKGLMELLGKEAQDKLDADQMSYIDRSLESVERMSSMVRALLEYSKSGNIKEELHAVTFGKAVSDVEISLREQISQNNVTIEVVNGETSMKVFPLQFSRILQNLLTNSIKFRNTDDPRIELHVQEGIDDWKVSVKDNGIGIEGDDKELVFDLFYYKSHDADKESHGIGLAVVKRLVEQHEGSISVDSTVGKGTTFTFTISKHL